MTRSIPLFEISNLQIYNLILVSGHLRPRGNLHLKNGGGQNDPPNITDESDLRHMWWNPNGWQQLKHLWVHQQYKGSR